MAGGIDVELVRASVTPALKALDVEAVEIVVGGPPDRQELWIGYRLRQGAERSHAELHDAAWTALPASVSYHSLCVCPIHKLPVTDPELVAQTRRLRLRPILLLAVIGVPLLLGVGTLLLRGRGDVIKRIEIRSAGKTHASFYSTGDDLVLWATLDGAFSSSPSRSSNRGVLPVRYEIDVIQNAKVVRHLSLDTHQRSVSVKYCSVAPDCEILLAPLPALPKGNVELAIETNPDPSVTRIDDLSLHVREEGTF
jgi:hypothetical protein